MKYNDYLKFWMDVLVHPGKATKRALTIKDALKLYYTLAIIPVVLGVVMVFVFGGVRSFSSSTSMFAAFPSLMGLLSTYGLEIGIGYLLFAILVMTPINAFINSGVYHLLIGRLFKIYDKKYPKVFTAAIFGTLPALMVYWLYPSGIVGTVVMGIFGLWGVIVEIIAFSNQLGMSRIKTLGTFVLYIAVVAAIVFVLALLVSFAFMRVF